MGTNSYSNQCIDDLLVSGFIYIFVCLTFATLVIMLITEIIVSLNLNSSHDHLSYIQIKIYKVATITINP